MQTRVSRILPETCLWGSDSVSVYGVENWGDSNEEKTWKNKKMKQGFFKEFLKDREKA